MQDGSAQLGSVKVGSKQATFREWLCATGSVQVGSARVCSAQCALHGLRRAISHESRLRKLHCSRLRKLLSASCCTQVLCASCSAQVALRKCSAPVAPCKRFAHVLCASWSVQGALRKCSVQVLCASCSAQVALASDSAQVALRKLWECTSRTVFVLKSCDFPAGAAGVCSAYYVCT